MSAQQYLTRQEFLDQSMPGDVYTGLQPTTIDAALLWASGVAASYLRKRYQLPLVSWGEELKSVVGELAQFKLLARRGIRPDSGNAQLAVKRYDDAIAWLKDVAGGLVEIDCVDGSPQVEEDGSLSLSDAPLSWRSTTGPLSDDDE